MLGENICRLRKLKNLSQEQLGALVGGNKANYFKLGIK